VLTCQRSQPAALFGRAKQSRSCGSDPLGAGDTLPLVAHDSVSPKAVLT
jgi:hypothetical protein